MIISLWLSVVNPFSCLSNNNHAGRTVYSIKITCCQKLYYQSDAGQASMTGYNRLYLFYGKNEITILATSCNPCYLGRVRCRYSAGNRGREEK